MPADSSGTAPRRPPGFLRRAIGACLPYEDREPLLRELDQVFEGRARTDGRASASAWYARQTAGFIVRVGATRLLEGLGGFAALPGDARLALRAFRRRPAFGLAFVVTLAVGTGVLATVYTAARWLLLRDVPGVAEPAQLATIRIGSTEAPPHVSWEISHPDYLILRDRLPLNGALAGMTPVEVDLRPEGGGARRVAASMVTSNYFSVLGARIAAGRGFLAEEDTRTAGQPVVVLSHALARNLAPDRNAVGMELRVNGALVRVVGVTAPMFRGATLPPRDEIWFPLSALSVIDPTANPQAPTRQGYGVWRSMVGRPGPSVTTELITATANSIREAVRAEGGSHSYIPTHFRLHVFPGIGLDPAVRASVRRTLSQLGLVAAFLLCLAVANLANLALIESTRRGATTAIRVALGASRMRVARGALVEIVLLALAASTLALGLAFVWSRWYQGVRLSEYGGALAGMHVDPGIALITLLAAVLAAAAAFLGPATSSRAGSIDLLLRRGAAGSRTSHGLRSILVAVQVALSLVLLLAAGLLGRTVNNLRSIELGFQPDRLLTFSLDPHLHGFESRRLDQLARNVEARLMEESDARGAGFVSPSPLRSSYVTASLYGSDDPDAQPLIGAGFYVTPGFLAALGVRTIAGESPWRADSATVVITRGALSRLLPGIPPAEAVGRVVPTRANRRNPVRVAAVIADIQLSEITSEPPPTFFRPLAERPEGLSLTGVVAAERAHGSLAATVRRVLDRHAPELPIFDVRNARAAVDLQFADRHAMARVASTLSAVGLLLAALGLYGVLAAVVAARRREIGIRSALGAAPSRILRRVLVNGLVPVAIGLPVGLVGAMAVSKLLAPRLFGLGALDPRAYAGAIGLLLLCAVAAALIPAFRAARLSPVEVLRDE